MSSQLDLPISDKESIQMILGLVTDNVIGQIQALDQLLSQKGDDYSGAAAEHTWMNFVQASEFSALTVEQVFFARLGEKIARLANLVRSGTSPHFEPIDETMVDVAGYLVLLVAYRLYSRQEKP